jgi:hypothetical protein
MPDLTDAEAQAAVEADADLRERLTETFNARGRALGWFDYLRTGEAVGLKPSARSDAFEFLMGVHAGLQAAGLPGFHSMELMVASTRGADFVFQIERKAH